MPPKFGPNGELLASDVVDTLPSIAPPERRSAWQKQTALSDHDYVRLHEVRSGLYMGGLQGLLYGSALGFFGSRIVQTSTFMRGVKEYIGEKQARKCAKWNKNHFTVATLCLGSFGMFLGALTAGKKALPYISDIITKGSQPKNTYELQRKDDIADEMKDSHERRKEAIMRAKQGQSDSEGSPWNIGAPFDDGQNFRS